MPMKKEYLIEAVNRSGFPLEVAVASLVKKPESIWNLESTGYAIQFQGKRGEIDCVLRGKNKRKDTIAVVECKRAHPDFKTWVLFDEVKPTPENKGRCLWLIEERGGIGLSFSVVPYDFPQIAPVPLVSQAVEVGTNKSGKKYNTEQIYQACLQVCTNLFALASESALDGSFSFNYVLPVVVTTAILNVVENSDSVIDIVEGAIDPEQVELREVPYVFRSFAFPLAWQQHVTQHTADSGNLLLGGRFKQNRLHILVVNAGHLEEFLKKSGDFKPDCRQAAKIRIYP